MGAIFLSYAREDRRFAEKLARVLEGAGHSVWWDRRLDGGEEFSAEIETALGQSDVVVVAWSKESVKSRWVRDEAAVGGDTGKLVPVSMDGSLPPMGFRQFHTLELADWRASRTDERTAELLHSVERRLKGKGKATAAVPITKQDRRLVLPRRKAMWIAAAALLLIIGAGATVFLLNRGSSPRGPTAKLTVALLPFTTASADPGLRDIAAQARDSISHTLSQSGIPVRLLSSVPQDRRSAGDFLLSGEVSKSGDKVIATVHVDEAIHGVTIVTQRLEAVGDDARNLPERIGVQAADFLADNLILDMGHPIDPALMAEMFSGQAGDFVENYQIAKRVAAKAPDNPDMLTAVAYFTGFALSALPRDERQQAVIEARRAQEKALKLAPERGAYASWCFLHSESRMIECEDHIRAGVRTGPDAPWPRQFLSGRMLGVGRFDEAVELANLSYSRSPYSFFMIRSQLRMLEFVRDHDGARELYQQAIRWYPENKFSFFRNRLFGLIYLGDFDAMQRLEQEVGADLPADYPKSGPLLAAVKSKSRPALRKACATTEDYALGLRCLIAFATIGDLDSAYAIADKYYPRRVGRTPAETEQIWLDEPDGAGPTDFIASPGAAPMRRDPRYLALAERTGLLAYWRSGRLPDFCRKPPEPICAELSKRR